MLPKRIDAKLDRREFVLGLAYGVIGFTMLDMIVQIPDANAAATQRFAGTYKTGHNWFGNGQDGALTVASGTTTQLGSTANAVYLGQFTSITLSAATSTLTAQNNLKAMILLVTGNVTNSGHIHMDGKGSSAATPSYNQLLSLYSLTSGKRGPRSQKYVLAAGAGGGNGHAASGNTNGGAGTAGSAGSTGQTGGGGGGGSGGGSGGFNSGKGGNGLAGTAWASGPGGGGGGGAGATSVISRCVGSMSSAR